MEKLHLGALGCDPNKKLNFNTKIKNRPTWYDCLKYEGFDPYQKIKFEKPNKKSYNSTRPTNYIHDEIGQFTIPRRKGRIFKLWKLFYLYISKDLIWFRFFTRFGLHIKNTTISFCLFSSRENKDFKIGKYIIKFLR